MGSCSQGAGESAVEGKHEHLEFANFVLLFLKGDLLQALATFTAYASYPTLDCLSQNFVQCGQAIK